MSSEHHYILKEIEARISDSRNLFANPNSFNSEEIYGLACSLVSTFDKGGKVAFFGNGGSAAEAMHIAAEFTGKCVLDHKPLDVICLNESQSALTAIANDFGIESMFSRQVDAHLKEGDILIALSTSGKSRNVTHALELAVSRNIRSIIWMGDFPLLVPGAEAWKVPSKQTPRIQEIHLAWGHILAEAVELIIV